MKKLDVVKLNREFSGFCVGSIGTIIFELDEIQFEVEFVDEAGYTIDVISVPAEFLELVEAYKGD